MDARIKKEGSHISYEYTGKMEWYLADSATDQLFWYQITADTLTGEGLLPGDLALIEEGVRHVQGQITLVYLPEEEQELLCRVFQQDNSLILQCANPLCPPRIYSGKEVSKIKFIGTVKEIRRKY